MDEQLVLSQVTTTDWMLVELAKLSLLLDDMDWEAKAEAEAELNKLREEYFLIAKKKPF